MRDQYMRYSYTVSTFRLCADCCSHHITNTLFRTGHGFILVYSIISRATFDEVMGLREQITRVKVRLEHSTMMISRICKHCSTAQLQQWCINICLGEDWSSNGAMRE